MTFGNIQDMRTQAIAPAVSSYQASKPEVTSAFENRATQLGAEKQPLIDRYQGLLDQLKGRETKETTQQSNALATTYGQRGIDTSSGAYQEDLANKLGDISQYYGGQTKDVTLSRESDIRDLTNQITNLTDQKVTALRSIDNKIAELQAGAGNQAATDALTNYRALLDQKFQSRFDELDTKVKEASLNKVPEYKTVEFDKGLYGFNPATNSITELLKKSGGASGNPNSYYNQVTNPTSNNRLVGTSQYNPSWQTPPDGYGYNSNGQLIPL